jgi:hypothetical protein
MNDEKYSRTKTLIMNFNNLLLLIFFISFNLTKIQCQTFAPIGAEWNFPETFAFSPNIKVISFSSIGDSIVENKTYRVIEKDKSSCLLRFSGKQLIYQNNDSIFHLNNETNELNLIIDFGAEQGETWYIKKYSDTEFPDSMLCRVDTVTTELLEGNSFNVQYVTLKPVENGTVNDLDSLSTRIIENIGFEEALFPVAFSYVCDGNFEGKIRCYQDENLGLIQFSEEECLMTSTKDLIQNSEINIFPNPTNSILNIEIDGQDKIQQIEMFDLAGKVIIRKQNDNQINVTDFQTGIYILKIRIDDIIRIQKVIVGK